jgi:hypothetical protein
MKIHGQAWNRLASVRIMCSIHDADISLARRIADAVAAGDRAEAIRLTRELERALTNTPDPSAHAAPSFTGTDYATALFGQRVEPRTLAAFSSALTRTDTATP